MKIEFTQEEVDLVAFLVSRGNTQKEAEEFVANRRKRRAAKRRQREWGGARSAKYA